MDFSFSSIGCSTTIVGLVLAGEACGVIVFSSVTAASLSFVVSALDGFFGGVGDDLTTL